MKKIYNFLFSLRCLFDFILQWLYGYRATLWFHRPLLVGYQTPTVVYIMRHQSHLSCYWYLWFPTFTSETVITLLSYNECGTCIRNSNKINKYNYMYSNAVFYFDICKWNYLCCFNLYILYLNDITEILLKVVLNTITLTSYFI